MMEAVRASEISVYCKTTQLCVPEGSNFHVVWMFSIFLKKAYIISYLSRIRSAPDDISCPQVANSAFCVVGMSII
jgi:hypothetical protein